MSPRRLKAVISMPAGATSMAACKSPLLNDPSLKLPQIPATRMVMYPPIKSQSIIYKLLMDVQSSRLIWLDQIPKRLERLEQFELPTSGDTRSHRLPLPPVPDYNAR